MAPPVKSTLTSSSSNEAKVSCQVLGHKLSLSLTLFQVQLAASDTRAMMVYICMHLADVCIYQANINISAARPQNWINDEMNNLHIFVRKW